MKRSSRILVAVAAGAAGFTGALLGFEVLAWKLVGDQWLAADPLINAARFAGAAMIGGASGLAVLIPSRTGRIASSSR